MITGDHHNIGKELARQIDLGMDIRTPDCLQPPSEARDLIVMKCDGFAKVKPLDKHEVGFSCRFSMAMRRTASLTPTKSWAPKVQIVWSSSIGGAGAPRQGPGGGHDR